MLTHVTICIHICTFPRIDIYVYIYINMCIFVCSYTHSSTHMHCILHAWGEHYIHSHIYAHIQDNHINTLICLGTRELTHLLKHSYTHLIILLKLLSTTFKGSLKLVQLINLRLLIINWSQSHVPLFRFSMWFYSHFTRMCITPQQRSIIRCDCMCLLPYVRFT